MSPAPRNADPSARSGLAYKAYEIEELVDVYFYRRLGIVLARRARLVGMSPNAMSIAAGLIGLVGGALLSNARLAPLGVVLVYLYGVVDSADGQLARMSGQISELGRVLDGVAGYVTHIAIYLSIAAVVIGNGSSWWVLLVVAASGVCTAAHAQMYEYHRTAYASIVLKRRVPSSPGMGSVGGGLGRLVAVYAATQRRLLGAHAEVEAAIARRSRGGIVREEDAQRYRAGFYRLVRGWNIMGDNVRRYGIAICVALHHIEWFLVVTLVPLNLVLAILWAMQRRADRRFLRVIAATPNGDAPA